MLTKAEIYKDNLWTLGETQMNENIVNLIKKLNDIKKEEIAALAKINAVLDECTTLENTIEELKTGVDYAEVLNYKVPDEEVNKLVEDIQTSKGILKNKMIELNAMRYKARRLKAKCHEMDMDLSGLIKMIGVRLKAKAPTQK